jgi:broad specificity phosphatase PhoE
VLTQLGLEQAAALPEALAGERIDAIYVSNMVRTSVTAAPLAAALDLEPIQREGIREVMSGDLEMLGDRASVETYMRAVYDWAMGDLDTRIPGGEDGHEFFARYESVLQEAAESGYGTIAVVSHGAAIRAWASYRGTNVPDDHILSHPIHNTGVVVAEGEPGGEWTVLTFQGEALGGERVDTTVVGPAGATA